MNTNKILAESIAKEYLKKEESKIIALKKLDAKVKRPATVFSVIFGTVFILVAGTGMCLAMQVIGNDTMHIIMGIVLGIIGFSACGLTYPIHKALLKKRKEKYAFEIIKLAREICEET